MAKNWVEVQSGRSGPLARTVQYLLKAQGYDVIVDDDVGPQTVAAVQAFQVDNSLPASGIVDNQTWPKLIVTIAVSDAGDAVRAAQDQLSLRVLPECQDLPVDGEFGPQTETAVRAFQTYVRDNQAWYLDEPMVVDGIVGVNTWYALVLDLGPLPE